MGERKEWGRGRSVRRESKERIRIFSDNGNTVFIQYKILGKLWSAKIWQAAQLPMMFHRKLNLKKLTPAHFSRYQKGTDIVYGQQLELRSNQFSVKIMGFRSYKSGTHWHSYYERRITFPFHQKSLCERVCKLWFAGAVAVLMQKHDIKVMNRFCHPLVIYLCLVSLISNEFWK